MRSIGTKYQTSGELTKEDGTPLPQDEPVILFRAKDKLVPQLLEHYQELCQNAGCSQEYITQLQQRLDEIRFWQTQNQEKVKVPD